MILRLPDWYGQWINSSWFRLNHSWTVEAGLPIFPFLRFYDEFLFKRLVLQHENKIEHRFLAFFCHAGLDPASRPFEVWSALDSGVRRDDDLALYQSLFSCFGVPAPGLGV